MRMLLDGRAEVRGPGASQAFTTYPDDTVVPEHERRRVGSWFGRYVWRRERRAVTAHVRAIGRAATVLDVPSGSGRWLPVLERLDPTTVEVRTDAEQLPYVDESFDLVFCHSSTQHLPLEAQAAVLRELGRVTRRHVICSFTVRAGIPGLALRLRELVLGRSNAVSWGWLARAAADAELHAVRARGCTSHLGAERSVLFSKVRPVVDGW
jgi:ubiquinone/menaquinone biosynthesis C-methylase UbiE